MSRRTRLGAVALALVACLLSGCSLVGGGDDDRQHATTTFEDVADLAPGAPVFMADVRIGNVTDIDLDATGTQATLELAFDRSAGVPAEVEARIRRTSPLGEKFVELRPLTDAADPPLLEDGAVIERTEVVADLEDVVASGTDVFAALGASEIATLLDEGARGFGGQGANIRSLLTDFGTVVGGFADNTDDITTLIESIDELASATGPSAQTHARALGRAGHHHPHPRRPVRPSSWTSWTRCRRSPGRAAASCGSTSPASATRSRACAR